MPSNIEIKARVQDAGMLEAKVIALATEGPVELEQHDTFFAVPRGRLKLRRFSGGNAELICYERPDSAGPAASDYLRVAVADPESLAALLSAALGVRGEVRKTRRLYWVGRTRVHLDHVAGLGRFVELEVTLADGDSRAEGAARASELVRQLGIAEGDLVDCAYLDLILNGPG